MNIKINKKELLKGLEIVRKVIPSVSNIPSLTGVVISVDVDHIEIIGSNGQFSIKHSIKKKENILSINKIGRILFKTRYLIELIKKIDDEFITIEAFDESMVRIICDNSVFELKPLKYSSYPNITFKQGSKLKINTTNLHELINFTKNAASENLQRIILTGIFLEIKNNKLRAIATNSHRLANFVIDTDIDDEFSAIIPNQLFKELGTIIDEDSDVFISKINGRVVVEFKNNIIQINEIEGTYPNIDKLIPSEFDIKIKVNKNNLLSVVERSIILSDNTDKAITFNIKNKTIELINASQNIGAAKEVIKLSDHSGEDIKITFKSKYILDSLKSFISEDIVFNITSNLKPVIINEVSNNSNFQLVLPYKI